MDKKNTNVKLIIKAFQSILIVIAIWGLISSLSQDITVNGEELIRSLISTIKGGAIFIGFIILTIFLQMIKNRI
jgi:hypothetical protein